MKCRSLFIHISLKGLCAVCHLFNHYNNNNYNAVAVGEIKRRRFRVLKRHRFGVPPIREAVATSICPFQKCSYCNCQEYMPQNPKTPRSLYSIHHHQLPFLCFISQLATPRLSVNSFSKRDRDREEEMEGAERQGRWKNLKQRLRFKGIGCCGSSWSYNASSMSILEEIHHEEEEELFIGVRPIPATNRRSSAYVSQIPAASGMNLASALAAERNSRTVGPTTAAATAVPLKTLMRLIEETDGVDLMKNRDKEGGGDGVCCVCMERNKGAAFIPCGHTFCRVCSRELWLNRGCCPICNRSILEILDIF